ncbi:MAG TPA: DUF1178 family protein [Desulfobacteraceae bacterium]|nr:DUF1178 family protein [Desulfobacteraceae bacterium]
MIVFELECGRGHRFEGWFDGAEAFESQLSGGMLICPYCEDTDVRKVMSPVAVKKSMPETLPQKAQSIDYRRLASEMVQYMKDNFEDVGTDFTSEALKMHYGVTEKKNIRGSATDEEEKTLKQEGVEFHKIMVPKIEEDKTN